MPSKQGIFIGIGGTGVNTVAQIKAKLLNDPLYNGNLNNMLKDNHFIFLDTDEKTLGEINGNSDLVKLFKGQSPIDIGSEFKNLGATKPYMIYTTAKTSYDENSKRLMEWVIDPSISGNFALPNIQLQQGAGAQRMSGRTAVWQNWDFIVTQIQAGVKKMTGYSNFDGDNNGNISNQAALEDELADSKPSIWVFGSSNGGTGSSAILDVLYIADRVFQSKFKTDPYLRLVLFMPKPFIEQNEKNIIYSLNAFSTFWELNAFRYDAVNNNDGKKFKHFSARPDKDNWDTIPGKWNGYSYMIPIDAETDKNKSIKLDDLFINTAEMCYYLHRSAIGDVAVSRLDNDIKDVAVINNPRQDKKTPFKWTNSLVAVGYKAICKPDDLLKEYIKSRFLYDLFDYGLLGYEFKDIQKNDEMQNKAKEEFGNKYIFEYLVKTGTHDAESESLEKEYSKKLCEVKIIGDESNTPPTVEEWGSIFNTFRTQIQNKVKTIENAFSTSGDELSKEYFLNIIKVKINEGVENSIKKYGILYTIHLIFLVDNKYCEIESEKLLNSIPSEDEINTIIYSINEIVEKGDRKKDFPKLKAKLLEYRSSILKKCINRSAIAILKDLTEEKEGYLEVLRNGNATSKGLSSVKSDIDTLSTNYCKEYKNLAKKFKKTNTEVFTTFIPSVSSFSTDNDTKTWTDNHLFEQLYADIISIDSTDQTIRKGNKDMGFPPIRDNGKGKSLINALVEINNKLKSNFFINLSFQTSYDSEYKLADYIIFAEKYIDDKISANGEVLNWLNKTLEQVFDYFCPTPQARNAFIQSFTGSIPVLFPRRDGSTGATGATRYLYAGSNLDFATKLGYNSADTSKQFKVEQNLTNRFIVFKMEVGHNLFDYGGFDDIANVYSKKKSEIENLAFGCHIHKDFVKLDINKIVSNVDRSFIEILLYDAFFKELATKNAVLYNNLFNNNTNVDQVSELFSNSNDDQIDSKTSNHNSLIEINKSGNLFTIKYRKLEIISHKLTITSDDAESEPLEEVYDFSEFFVKTKNLSKIFSKMVNTIKKVIDDRASSNRNDFLTAFSSEFDSIKKNAARTNLKDAFDLCSKGVPVHEAIKKEFFEILDNIKSNNVFNQII